MPARPCVALLACCAALADGGWCAQRGLSEFVILPSGRSHRASLFGMSCISALLLVLCCNAGCSLCGGLHWLHWMHWSQTRRSDGVSAAAFLQWIYQYVAYSGL